MYIGLFVAATLLGACVYPLEDGQRGPSEVTASFALSLKQAGQQEVATKMSSDIVQTNGRFRGIEQLYVVPFEKAAGNIAVTANDPRLGDTLVDLYVPGIKSLINTSNAYLYQVVSVPRNMNRVLTYGKASDKIVVESERARKHRNGVLSPTNLANPSYAGDVSFHLESIVSSTDSSAIFQMADQFIAALNGIVKAIRNSGEPTFDGIFDYAEDQILACSFYTFNAIQDNVLDAVWYYPDPTIRRTIIDSIDVLVTLLNSEGKDFPESFGIPEGAIGFWWNGREFRRLISGVNVRLVPLGLYAYPPSLWYFVNSPIKTTTDETVNSEYSPGNTWEAILNKYDSQGGMVLPSTRSVAISYPLQYGVAMLELRFSGNDTSAVNNCPLTGVLVANQRDVDFEFKPLTPASGEFVVGRYVYDIVEQGPRLGHASTDPVTTLMLQTPPDSPDSTGIVHFALEFMNTTGQTLHCQQGSILSGSKFYLAGKLDPKGKSETIKSIFCQDHKTTVTVTVQSLQKAYTTVPDMYDPQLEVGIVAEMDWMQVQPSSVKLNL